MARRACSWMRSCSSWVFRGESEGGMSLPDSVELAPAPVPACCKEVASRNAALRTRMALLNCSCFPSECSEEGSAASWRSFSCSCRLRFITLVRISPSSSWLGPSTRHCRGVYSFMSSPDLPGEGSGRRFGDSPDCIISASHPPRNCVRSSVEGSGGLFKRSFQLKLFFSVRAHPSAMSTFSVGHVNTFTRRSLGSLALAPRAWQPLASRAWQPLALQMAARSVCDHAPMRRLPALSPSGSSVSPALNAELRSQSQD
jgi:hypothetical protein